MQETLSMLRQQQQHHKGSASFQSLLQLSRQQPQLEHAREQTLQHTATHCGTLGHEQQQYQQQQTHNPRSGQMDNAHLQHTATHCNALELEHQQQPYNGQMDMQQPHHLQHEIYETPADTATHYKTLQHTATHSNPAPLPGISSHTNSQMTPHTNSHTNSQMTPHTNSQMTPHTTTHTTPHMTTPTPHMMTHIAALSSTRPSLTANFEFAATSPLHGGRAENEGGLRSATYCNTLQCTATHCNTLQTTATHEFAAPVH